MNRLLRVLFLLTLSLGVGKFSHNLAPDVEAFFPDVPESHTYFNAVNFVEEKGIIDGYPNGVFKPDKEINRAEFLKIIVEANFSDEVINNCDVDTYRFTDGGSEEWYSSYLCLGKKSGLVEGYSNGKYRPAAKINFAEAAKILVLAENLDSTTSFQTAPGEEWFQPFINYLGQNKAIPATVNSNSRNITRGEMAEMIYLLKLKNIVND